VRVVEAVSGQFMGFLPMLICFLYFVLRRPTERFIVALDDLDDDRRARKAARSERRRDEEMWEAMP
jgi:hypothetical protein